MEPVDPRMLKFIHQHHILTLAVSLNDQPWCATCFYEYLDEKNMFIFTSDDETRHIQYIIKSGNNQVAGAVALETTMVGKIRGIQFAGKLIRLEKEELKEAKKAYIRKFPIAALAKLELWGLVPDEIKMTDNRLGFGKKLFWNNESNKK